MNKVKQFLIARACGFPSSHELISEAMNDENFIHELSVGLTITKDDLFSKTSTGKYLFEYPEVWGKLDKLNKFLADSKLEPLTGADLAQDREGGAAISHAFKCQRVMDAFTADLWKGQPAAMERAWFSLSSSASISALRKLPASSTGPCAALARIASASTLRPACQ